LIVSNTSEASTTFVQIPAIAWLGTLIAEYTGLAMIGAAVGIVVGSVTYVLMEQGDEIISYLYPDHYWTELSKQHANEHAHEFGVSESEFFDICKNGANSPLSINALQQINVTGVKGIAIETQIVKQD